MLVHVNMNETIKSKFQTLFRVLMQKIKFYPSLIKLSNVFVLCRESLNKYLRDAQGSKGTKQLHKWCSEHPDSTILSKKMCKLVYVIVRLLQNAR